MTLTSNLTTGFGSTATSSNANDVFFGATGSTPVTVTVAASQTVGTLTINSGAPLYTFNGSGTTITLLGPQAGSTSAPNTGALFVGSSATFNVAVNAVSGNGGIVFTQANQTLSLLAGGTILGNQTASPRQRPVGRQRRQLQPQRRRQRGHRHHEHPPDRAGRRPALATPNTTSAA